MPVKCNGNLQSVFREKYTYQYRSVQKFLGVQGPFFKKGPASFPPRSLQILPMYAAVYVGTADKSVPRKRIEDFVYLTQILRISGVGLFWGIRRGQHSGGADAAVVDLRVVRAKYADLPD